MTFSTRNLTSPTWLVVAVGGLTCLIAQHATGGITDYLESDHYQPGQRASWLAAAGGQSRSITFSEAGIWPNMIINTQYSTTHGVTFDVPIVPWQPSVTSWGYPESPGNHLLFMTNYLPNTPSQTSGLVLDFATPQRAIGFDRIDWPYNWNPPGAGFVPLHIRLTNSDGSLVGQWNLTVDLGLSINTRWHNFIGITSDQAFDRAQIWFSHPDMQVPGGQGWYLDDVHYSTVPAPGALIMFAVAGLGITRKRRQCELARLSWTG